MTKNQQSKLGALVRAGRLEFVIFDGNFFEHQIENCTRGRLDAVALVEGGSLQGAFTLAYGYMRKSATMLLYCRGVRPTARGGHRVVVEALGLEPKISQRLLAVYEQLRTTRNSNEYPDAVMAQVDRALIEHGLDIGDDLIARACRARILPMAIWPHGDAAKSAT